MTPKKPISIQATEITGLTVRNGKMFHHGKPVESIPISKALDGLMNFITGENVYLAGHNIKTFDCHILFNALKLNERVDEFKTKVDGFIDTKLLFKQLKPGLESYSQVNLVNYSAHDAPEDVVHLQN